MLSQKCFNLAPALFFLFGFPEAAYHNFPSLPLHPVLVCPVTRSLDNHVVGRLCRQNFQTDCVYARGQFGQDFFQVAVYCHYHALAVDCGALAGSDAVGFYICGFCVGE